MSENELRVAVVGATGAVGREIVGLLAERQLPIATPRLFASERSLGSEVDFGRKSLTSEVLGPDSLSEFDIVFFSAGTEVSSKYVPQVVQVGALAIDTSSAFRLDRETALIVPEVNSEVLRSFLQERPQGKGAVLASPCGSVVQLAVVLKPIMERAGIERIVVSTYQAVARGGRRAMEELWEQTRGIFTQEAVEPKEFSHQIAFDCIPQCDAFLREGHTKEELELIAECRIVLGAADLRISSTAVQVPVFSCDSQSVNIALENPLSAEECRELLRESPGIVVLDSPEEGIYPVAAELSGNDAVYVGRIRADHSLEKGLNMWIVVDALRKGTALNAVQIAEIAAQERSC